MPEGWSWSRLNFIITIATDYVANGSFKTLKDNVRTYKEPNYALFIRTVDFSNNFTKDLSYIDEESYNFLEKSKLFGGELMLSNIGASIGKVFKIPNLNRPMSLAPNSIILRFYDDITSDYFEYVFKSFVGQNYLASLTAGTAMPKFSKTELKQMLVPVPPLKEQEKIVQQCKICMKYVDIAEQEKEELINIIDDVKKKMLDLAIRGQLVPQNPDDEPASVLLEHIRAEKEKLIKAGKIKRDKKESVIFRGEDNSYYIRQGTHIEAIDDQFVFDLPYNWEWCSLLNVAKIDLGKTLDSAKNTGTYYPYLRSVNVRWNDVDLTDLKEMRFEPEEIERYTIKCHDLLICEGGDVGRSCVWTADQTILYQNALHRVRFYRECNPFYFMYYMMYYESRGIIKSLCKGVTIKHLTGNVLSIIPFALPPIEEQNRIVAKLKRIFDIFDNIISD